MLLWAGSISVFAQPNITRIEYFIDADPGRGSGTAIILSSPTVNILENVPTGALSEGFHVLTVRAEDEFGVWGLIESKPFYVSLSSTLTQNNIAAMEYFIDADPGRGLGVDIPITAATNLNILENVPTSLLSEGFHLITVRAQDENGVWGLSESKPFYVNQSTTTIQNNIAAMEYFIDADPGRGLGVDIPITAATNLNILENVPTSLLSEGFHLITVRAQDENGVWGLSESKPFYVNLSSAAIPNNLIAMEYYFDSDPGYGNGILIAVTPAVDINILQNIPIGSLSNGLHVIFIRAQDENGNWGQAESKSFFVDESRLIINYEYAIDTDPGIGLATQQAIIPPQNSIDETLIIDTTPLTLGNHDLILRVQDSNLFWSKTNTVTFDVCDGATAGFTADVVCQGNATTFTDLSTNVLVGDIYNWDFDSDGTIDDNTTGNVTFAYPSAGTYTATLEINRAGCVASKFVTVDVGGLPASNAGANQNICIDNTTLAAQPLLVGETGQWVVLNGTGTFSLATDPASNVTGLTSGLNEFQWEVTDPSGICTTTDIAGITYLVVSTADAGADQAVCIDNTIFTAVTPSVGETGQWTLLSGSGTLSDSTDPNSTIAGLTAGINEFQWEVTDGSGTCTSTDFVQLD